MLPSIVPWMNIQDLVAGPGKLGRQAVARWLLTLVLFVTPASVFGQKVETQYDKAAHFKTYKRYAWNKNYLLTRQHPEDQAQIDKVIVASLDRQLQSKGYVLDDKNPDFRVKYEAGALMESGTGGQPDMLNGGTMGPEWSSTSLGSSSMDVWTTTVSKMKVTVTDAATGKDVWQAFVSQKVRDPKKFMNDLNKNVDNIMSKTMKKFPPGSKQE
jgi:hypothetical protein